MKVLTTSTSAQQLEVIPRSYPATINIKLRNEITNEVTTISSISTTTVKGYLRFSTAYDLDESYFYELTILDGSSVIYKDKIFCTNQTIADYSVNVDTLTWDQDTGIWNLLETDWEDEGIVDIYETEDTYDNDYIII
jgi:hypothetical protein